MGRGGPSLRAVGGLHPNLVIAWELRARPGAEGLAFALGLPRADPSTLVPGPPRIARPGGPGRGAARGRGPGRAPAAGPGGSTGRGGRLDLRLRDVSTSLALPPAWVGGTTHVELDEGMSVLAGRVVRLGRGRRASAARGAARPGAGIRLDVAGPAVALFRRRAGCGAGTRPHHRPERRREPRHADARDDPAAGPGRPRKGPLDGPGLPGRSTRLWTGGTTLVRPGSRARALEQCRELGRPGRVAAPPDPDAAEQPTAGGLVLAFDAARPAAVAELTFALAPGRALGRGPRHPRPPGEDAPTGGPDHLACAPPGR